MKYALLLACFICFFALGQKDSFLEKTGVQNKTNWSIRDSVLINQLNKISSDSTFLNTDKSEKYARIAYRGASKIEYKEGEISGLRNLIRCKIYRSDFDSAVVLVNQLLPQLNESIPTKVLVRSYETVGNVYDYQGKYDEAIKYYLEAIDAASPSSLATASHHNIGLIYRKLNNFKKAYEYFQNCEDLSRKTDDFRSLASTLNNLGIIKRNEKKYGEALAYYEEGLVFARKIDNIKLEGDLLANMANVHFEQGDPQKGMQYFERSLEWSKKTQSNYELAISHINFAYNLTDINRLQEAEQIAKKAVTYSKLSKNYEFIMESYWILADIKSKRGKHSEAYADLNRAFEFKDSMNLVALSNEVSGLEAEFQRKKEAIADSIEKVQLKKEFEHDQKLSKEKLWFRDLLLVISIFVLAMVAVGAFLLFKSNKKVKAKNEIVEQQHKEITDSINYAQRIQSAMISNDEAWKQISPHRSIFFKPKDVVSGDFYWAHFNVEKNLAIWCVADCTGHGVPGAFMSALGSSFLTDIIVDDGETDPAKILNLLRSKVIASLTKNEVDQPTDGMDLALCVWEKNNNVLHFAGANNPLYLIRKRENVTSHEFRRYIDLPKENNVLYEVPPNKMPIGSYEGNESSFKSIRLQLHFGDTLIMPTDGYADQFGGERGKKFKSRPFKEFLLKLQDNPISEQTPLIEEHFNTWKGSHEQLDDVCIVGIRIS